MVTCLDIGTTFCSIIYLYNTESHVHERLVDLGSLKRQLHEGLGAFCHAGYMQVGHTRILRSVHAGYVPVRTRPHGGGILLSVCRPTRRVCGAMPWSAARGPRCVGAIVHPDSTGLPRHLLMSATRGPRCVGAIVHPDSIRVIGLSRGQ